MKGSARRRFRFVRRSLRERVIDWVALEAGSTNRLWRGRGRGGSGGWLLKWYRYPQTGIHPEVEVAGYLGGCKAAPVPSYGGCLEERLEGGEWRTVAMVQRWVDGVSAWDWLLERLRAGEVPIREVETWGAEIGRLHGLLASGSPGSGFTSVAWGASDAGVWGDRLLAVGEALQLAVCSGEFGKRCGQDLAERVRSFWVEQASVWRARVAGVRQIRFEGRRSRIHGDLHLGQLLRMANGGTVVVDFEGEPLRAFEERRRGDLPLRDVAGMWRSFAYAGAVSGVDRGVVTSLQEAFLKGWLGQVEQPSADWRGVLADLVWEKAIYEVLYEIRHRPDWVWVPWMELERGFAAKTVAPGTAEKVF
jgi:predicted trehalose synthase